MKRRVAALPADGAANTELCRFLAKAFRLPRHAVCLLAGAGSPQEGVLLRHASAQRIRERWKDVLTLIGPLLLFTLAGCASSTPVLYPNPHLQTVGKEQAQDDIAD